jgi:hypothetical protein
MAEGWLAVSAMVPDVVHARQELRSLAVAVASVFRVTDRGSSSS